MSEAIHIVVIDDNPGSLELLSTALTRAEVAVHTASTPAEGLALVRKLHPQLVVTDLVMPEMSGLEVLREIVEFDPMIDVLLMTAHYTTETAVAAIRSGAADYLQKPVKIAQLRERVAALLASAEHRRKASAIAEQVSDFAFEGMIAASSSMWQLFVDDPAHCASLPFGSGAGSYRNGQGPDRQRTPSPQPRAGKIHRVELLRGGRDIV